MGGTPGAVKSIPPATQRKPFSAAPVAFCCLEGSDALAAQLLLPGS